MVTIKDKMAGQQAATPHKIMPNDPDRLHMTRDQAIAKDRKLAEIDAKLELERKRLEEIAEQETKALEKVVTEDNATQGTTEEV